MPPRLIEPSLRSPALQWYYAHREEHLTKHRAYRAARKKARRPGMSKEQRVVRNKELRRASYLKNRDKIIARNKTYAARDPELTRARHSRYMLKRLASKRSRVHPDHDSVKELGLFLEAQRMTSATGIDHEVDHIIPLSSGGFHHHENLQVLPASVNRSKAGDPFWENPSYKTWRSVPRFLWPDNLATSYLALIETPVVKRLCPPDLSALQ